MYYDLLRQFVRREGHARVPENHREGNFSLGLWVSKRRTWYRKGLLTREQVRSLEELPGWTWSLREDGFQRGLAAVTVFARREGHALVPRGHVEDRFNLVAWVSTRRLEHARGRLSGDRVRALEAVAGWSWNPLDDNYQAALEALRRFANREGHARVRFDHREGPIPLGNWVDTQRQFKAQGRLSRERSRLLESVPGWTWRVRDDRFDDGMRALQAFVRREGHARVPDGWVEQGVRLDLWVTNRRRDYQKGTLPIGRVRALESLPEWTWSVHETAFATGYRYLLRFVEREGHARVPTAHIEAGFPLGAWVHKCRQRRGRLGAEHERQLAALPGWVWNRFDWQFEEALSLLRVFVGREGHACVPVQHVERGFRLGVWARHCRSRSWELTERRRNALEGIPGWVWKQGPRTDGSKGSPRAHQ